VPLECLVALEVFSDQLKLLNLVQILAYTIVNQLAKAEGGSDLVQSSADTLVLGIRVAILGPGIAVRGALELGLVFVAHVQLDVRVRLVRVFNLSKTVKVLILTFFSIFRVVAEEV
jgi:hypothetical protein